MFRKSTTTFKIILFLLVVFTFFSCIKEDKNDEKCHYKAGLSRSQIKIDNILNIPSGVEFDKIKVKLSGNNWKNIDEIETSFHNGEAILILPTSFAREQLQIVDRQEEKFYGFWPAKSDNPSARVATLKDIIAYKGEKKVGRLYLSNEKTESFTEKRLFVHYQYGNEPFTLTGSNKSFYYSECSFRKGWNAYATINPNLSNKDADQARCTTNIPTEFILRWFFESWVY